MNDREEEKKFCLEKESLLFLIEGRGGKIRLIVGEKGKGNRFKKRIGTI